MQIPEPRFSVMPFGGYEPAEVDAFIDTLDRATAADPPTIGPEQVERVQFSRARLRGYHEAEVDQWLDLVIRALSSAGSGNTDPAGPAGYPPPTGSPAAPDFPPPPLGATPAAAMPTVPSGPPVSAAPGYPSSAVDVPEPQPGVVQQNNGLPRPVALGLVAALVVLIVLAVYYFA
ncbi:DivIVA domain-containing protein [Friedmanniella endophytica]|uniref:DivIVA domain-containing protein n=1 Tax=Microlunatus kandeliicorticis TaxID=1759536 RepID=A0A7W3IVE5_9ACTN|nr:DivIVA domain-containing protein [Microlunatus kandeliicorticis]MBA8795964.1 DivIVA domain-containing protein [Microlunatus kandeliicorticis]